MRNVQNCQWTLRFNSNLLNNKFQYRKHLDSFKTFFKTIKIIVLKVCSKTTLRVCPKIFKSPNLLKLKNLQRKYFSVKSTSYRENKKIFFARKLFLLDEIFPRFSENIHWGRFHRMKDYRAISQNYMNKIAKKYLPDKSKFNLILFKLLSTSHQLDSFIFRGHLSKVYAKKCY